MTTIENVREVDRRFPRVILTVGSFDGVHRGHQRILAELVRTARGRNGTAAVMTMLPHPREFFSPERAPNLLTSHEKKLELMEAAGVDVVFVLPFDAEIAHIAPEAFVRDLICERCGTEELIVGHDFRFGRDAEGDYHLLVAMGQELNFRVSQVAPFIHDGERVSSTGIRERLLEGDLEGAEALLGRKYSVVGDVLRGRGIGVTLGFPTANIKPHHTAVPAQGVYAAEVLLLGKLYPAAVNIGIAPTIAHDDTVIEAHLLDFHQEIRGGRIEVIFHKRLRTEKKFPSREALTSAIRKDVEEVRKLLSDIDGVRKNGGR